MELLETVTKEIDGYTITVNIYPDDLNESPREWDNLGTMVCFHGRYNLGDKHNYQSPEDLNRYVTNENCVSLPLYLYDHSGITISTSPFSCPWDSGQVGIIFISHENIRKEYSVKRITKKVREKVIKYLIGEVKTYDDFLTGSVYGFNATLTDKDGEEIAEDSCWGYYGDDGYNCCDPESSSMVKEAISNLECSIVEDRTKNQNHLKIMIRNHVPLENRI